MLEKTFMIWPDNSAMSLIVWMTLFIVILYIARRPAHGVISSASHTVHRAMRLAAKALMQVEGRLAQRNREVLLESGKEMLNHQIAREFERIDATVQRDLADYPALHRRLLELVTNIDQDYKSSVQVPPDVPAWDKAVAAVAKIPSRDPMVANILENIHDSMQSANKRVLTEYRKATHEQHSLLKRMLPHWRNATAALHQVDKNIDKVMLRSKTIDRHMENYEQLQRQEDRAMRMLSSSSLTQFFISAFVLAIAVGGAMINFNLIAHPMQEMVGGSSYIMGYKTANIAALVIILVEVAMGLFLMESLRITRLFPVIGSMSDKMRLRMVFVTFTILLILASVEAGLAYMREILAQDEAALRATLLAEQGAKAVLSQRWITTAAQMGMGFILPFALTFVAIPLESFVHSMRTVFGITGMLVLRSLAFIARLTGNIVKQVDIVLLQLYDLVICGPLWLERYMIKRRERVAHAQVMEATETVTPEEAHESNSKNKKFEDTPYKDPDFVSPLTPVEGSV
jgi:hypothetical protein